MMTKEQQRVKEWMRKFGQECPDKPTQINEKTAILRAKLILEEALETILKGLGIEVIVRRDASSVHISESNFKDEVEFEFIKAKEVNLVEVADGISDIMVVAEGTAVACGIDSEPVHQEVLRSNDSKLYTSEEIVALPTGFSCELVSDSEKGFLVKNEDGKVQKSPSYFPANILSILEKQER